MEKEKANENGKEFEEVNNIVDHLRNIDNISIVSILKKRINNKIDYNYHEDNIYKNNNLIGAAFKGNNLYKYFDLTIKDETGKPLLENYISKKILPDYCYYDINSNILYVFEMKYQNGAGSFDEKLQSFSFKIKQFNKLLKTIKPGIVVYYWYILYDGFFNINDNY